MQIFLKDRIKIKDLNKKIYFIMNKIDIKSLLSGFLFFLISFSLLLRLFLIFFKIKSLLCRLFLTRLFEIFFCVKNWTHYFENKLQRKKNKQNFISYELIIHIHESKATKEIKEPSRV